MMLMCVKMDAVHFGASQITMVNIVITHRTSMSVDLRDSTSDDNKVTAGKCGAIEVVVNVMKIHTDNASVCEYGCGALLIITDNNGKYHQTQN